MRPMSHMTIVKVPGPARSQPHQADDLFALPPFPSRVADNWSEAAKVAPQPGDALDVPLS